MYSPLFDQLSCHNTGSAPSYYLLEQYQASSYVQSQPWNKTNKNPAAQQSQQVDILLTTFL